MIDIFVVLVLVLLILFYYLTREPNDIQYERRYTYIPVVQQRKPAINVRSQSTASRNQSLRDKNGRPSQGQPKVIRVSVIEVPDGDGVRAFDLNADEILNVRLIGIDAPEMKGRQPFAVEAKRHLERLVLRETAILTKYSEDQYERILGNLQVPGKVDNVSLEMVKAGLACVYKGKGAEYGGMRNEFYLAEKMARTQKKGFWALDNLVLPGQYKRTLKG